LFSIGDRIKQTRNELGLSQKDFGGKINVSDGHMSAIEKGKDPPSERIIKLICIEFGINEEWLRTGVGEKFKPVVIDNKWMDDSKTLQNKPYLKKFLEILQALGPSGAGPADIPFLDEPELIKMFNYLQYSFLNAQNDKDKYYIGFKFENAFPHYQDVVQQLQTAYLKRWHTYDIIGSTTGGMDAVAEGDVSYKTEAESEVKVDDKKQTAGEEEKE
jgi:transcriptional regulator with XRE-family HTH domain